MSDEQKQPSFPDWETHLANIGDIPTRLQPPLNDASALDWMSRGTIGRTDPTQLGKPSYYDDLPEMERNKSPQDRTVSVLSNPFGQLPYLRAGVEAQNRGESFWGGTPQYERERKALQQYYNQAYEDAPDSMKVLSQIGLPGGPTSQAAKYLTSAERPIASGAAMGAAQAGVSGYLAPIEPDTSDWRSRLQSAAEAMPYGAVAGAAAGVPGKMAQPRYTTPEENAAFIERMRNAGTSTPEEIDAFIKGMGEPHEGAWGYADPQLEAPRKALPAPQPEPQTEQAPIPQTKPPKVKPQPQPIEPREVDELGYYSHALESAKALKQEKGTPGQMFSMLTKAPGVHENEIIATGTHRRILGDEVANAYERYIALRNDVDAKRQALARNGMYNSAALELLGRESGMSDKDWAAHTKALIDEDIGQPVQDLVRAKRDLDAAIRAQKGTITRDDIVRHLRDMRPTLQQKIRGEPMSLQLGAPRASQMGDGMVTPVLFEGNEIGLIRPHWRDPDRWSAVSDDYGPLAESHSSPESALRELATYHQDTGDKPKWSSYSLDPRNPTYRETTLYLESAEQPIIDRYAAERNRIAVSQEDWDALDNAGREQITNQLYDINWRESEELAPLFQSGHFEEPNITGHLMTSHVELPDGTKAFNIDQIQSDWGQRLRDEGARDEAKIAQLEAELGRANEENRRVEAEAGTFVNTLSDKDRNVASYLHREYHPLYQLPYGLKGDVEVLASYGPLDIQAQAKELHDALVMAQQTKDRITAELYSAKQSPKGHPLVNTTDQWTQTTLRKALQQAVENGADAITIPTGDTVLSYNPGDKHGMNEFYNNIVPKNMSKILKEYDPKAPKPYYSEHVKTPSQGLLVNRGDYPESFEGIEDHVPRFGFTVFPLTDKIKEAITRGQRMFKHGGAVHSQSSETHMDEHLPEHERAHSPEDAWEKAKYLVPYLRAGSESVKRGGSFWGGDEAYEKQLQALRGYYHGGSVTEKDTQVSDKPTRKYGGAVTKKVTHIADAFQKRLDGKDNLIGALERRLEREPHPKLRERIVKEKEEARRIRDHIAKVRSHA